jgi:hypothetical protein
MIKGSNMCGISNMATVPTGVALKKVNKKVIKKVSKEDIKRSHKNVSKEDIKRSHKNVPKSYVKSIPFFDKYVLKFNITKT